ncbi:MAG: hypothetical protein WBB76_01250 [Gaiellaceae bacterium]
MVETLHASIPRLSAERRVLLVSAAVAGLAALLLLVVVPVGGDASAHLYRTLLVQRGALIWDNLWFAGQYPLVSYSLLYYLPAAVVGNGTLATAAVILSALLFASLVLPVYRAKAARWPSYCFAAVVGGQFFTGDYPYTMGFAALLATLWALQRGRTWLALICAALTLGCSPLAFLFLCLTLFALWISSSQPRKRTLVVGGALALLAALELGALRLFHSRSLYYPFDIWRFLLGVPVGVIGAALAFRSREARPLASIFVVWTLATVAAYLTPSPVGHNLLRPATLVFPLMLLVAVLAGFRPRWLAYPAVVISFAANVGPYVATAVSRTDPASKASFWEPLLRYAATHSSANYRLEVVPTINHWESYYVPKAGFPIARGWYQQLDTADYPRINRSRLTARVYREWLRSVGVRYVIAAHVTPGAEATAEARLLASGRSGLVRVFESRSGSVYELPGPQAILTGPGPAGIARMGISSIAGWTSRPGNYLLRVHYTSLWKVKLGALCLRPGPGGMTMVGVWRAGRFMLQAVEEPGAAVALILDRDRETTRACA